MAITRKVAKELASLILDVSISQGAVERACADEVFNKENVDYWMDYHDRAVVALRDILGAGIVTVGTYKETRAACRNTN